MTNPDSPVWLAVKVRPNHELRTACLLRSKGYEEFTPTYTVRRRWADRIKESQAALFPGYIFCRAELDIAQKIVTTSGVAGIVKFANTPAAIPSDEIESLKLAALDRSTQPWPFIERGKTVELLEGPLRGARGVVLSMDNGCKLVVSVQLLQRSVAVSIDRGWASIASNPSREPDRPSAWAWQA